jgi:hypothetical protein
MFGKASKSTIEKTLPALPTPPYTIFNSSLNLKNKVCKSDFFYSPFYSIVNFFRRHFEFSAILNFHGSMSENSSLRAFFAEEFFVSENSSSEHSSLGKFSTGTFFARDNFSLRIYVRWNILRRTAFMPYVFFSQQP